MRTSAETRLLKIVKDNYREIAAEFDATRKKYVWPELEKILENIKPGSHVLDIGCGNGRLLENLKDKKVSYLGVDNSEELINLAKINYPENNFNIVDVLELNKVVKNKFDLIISVAMLHHLPGKNLRLQALEQMKEATKSDGRIIFSVWKLWGNKKYRKYLYKNIWQKIIRKTDLDYGDILFPWKNGKGETISERYYHAFTKKELKDLLKKTGFKKFNLYSDKHNYWVIIDTPRGYSI